MGDDLRQINLVALLLGIESSLCFPFCIAFIKSPLALLHGCGGARKSQPAGGEQIGPSEQRCQIVVGSRENGLEDDPLQIRTLGLLICVFWTRKSSLTGIAFPNICDRLCRIGNLKRYGSVNSHKQSVRGKNLDHLQVSNLLSLQTKNDRMKNCFSCVLLPFPEILQTLRSSRSKASAFQDRAREGFLCLSDSLED